MNKELLNKVREPILRTWSNIAADAIEITEGDNEVAIELCIDADRLTMWTRGPKEKEEAEAAEAALNEVLDKHDYAKVLKFLSKNIQLL